MYIYTGVIKNNSSFSLKFTEAIRAKDTKKLFIKWIVTIALAFK